MLESILRGPLSFHAIAPPALQSFEGMRLQMREVAIAIHNDPSRAELHAVIGNGLIRETRYLEAIEAYRAAVARDPNFAAAHLALGELLAIARHSGWQKHLRNALELQRTYVDPEPKAGRVSVAMLLRDAPYSVNTPLELIIDRTKVALDKFYIESDALQLPRGHVLFCAFGYAREAVRAIGAAEKLIHRSGRPVVNRPEKLASIARERLHETLSGVEDVSVPAIRVLPAEEIRVREKTLVRPVDTHAGSGLALLEDQRELPAHLERHPAGAYHVSDFIEYASADGYYRKYRVIFVDGVPYPYHLGISPRWMVHYRNAPMAQNAWMRDEEAAFLSEPRRFFSTWDKTMGDAAEAIGLEYFGIDCAVLRDGRTLVFEADPAMLVHDEDPEGMFAYKRPAVAKIRDALTRMLLEKAQSTS